MLVPYSCCRMLKLSNNKERLLSYSQASTIVCGELVQDGFIHVFSQLLNTITGEGAISTTLIKNIS